MVHGKIETVECRQSLDQSIIHTENFHPVDFERETQITSNLNASKIQSATKFRAVAKEEPDLIHEYKN